MRIFFIVFFSFFMFQIANAQLTKVLHQTFEIDSVENISISIVGEYELEKWAGNNILTETKVEIYDTTPGTFKYIIEELKRYEIVAEIDNTKASLFSFDSKRAPIKKSDAKDDESYNESFELVKVRIFVPDDFNIENPNNLVRMIPSEASTNK